MPRARTIDFDHGITAIDTEYARPGFDASHLIVAGEAAAFVDTGTTYSVPLLLDALTQKGLARGQVRYVCVTHVHLDHAGGAGALMRQLPNARLVVHPRGAPHMADPTRLIAGTRAVYGDARTTELYGEIAPVAPERILAVADDEILDLDGRALRILHTPGHAYHHYCIVDEASAGVFTGDTFGVSYREFDTARGVFVFPTTTPVHFDPAAAHASIDRLLGFRPRAAYLTHFSRVTGLARLAADLHGDLEAFVALARREAAAADRAAALRRAMRAYLGERLAAHGCTLPAPRVDALLEMDIALNVQGLLVWHDRQA